MCLFNFLINNIKYNNIYIPLWRFENSLACLSLIYSLSSSYFSRKSAYMTSNTSELYKTVKPVQDKNNNLNSK